MKTLICIIATVGLACAADVDLAWDPSPSSNVAGYHIYYGITPNSTENKIVNVGLATQTTITGLLDNTTYYFTATAYFESSHSNQIVWSAGWSGVKYYPRAAFEFRMLGGVFEGTNGDPVTGPYTVIHTIAATPAPAWTQVEVDLGNYRYLRYRGPNNSYCNVAEIEFWRGSKLVGVGFGTPGTYGGGNTFDKALDGNINTRFDAPTASGAFVGIDTQ